MKRAWILRVCVITAILFIAVNIFLIQMDDSKVERLVYIDKWQAAAKEDIQKSFKSEGVIAPLEEYEVYYDSRQGIFNQFLVSEGDLVTAGTALYEYHAVDTTAEEARLTSEIEKLERQRTELNLHLNDLESYRGTLLFSEEEKLAERSVLSNLDKDIYEKRLQAGMIDADLEMKEKQLLFVQQQPGNVTVQSSYTGIVRNINESLSNPLITIASDQKAIAGELTLEEREETETGMKAIVSVSGNKQSLEGTISSLDDLPEVNKDTVKYSFQVIWNNEEADEEDMPKLLVGTPVSIRIITDEVFDAVTVPSASIRKTAGEWSVLTISSSGKLEKRSVDTGLDSKGKTVILGGLEESNIIVVPDSLFSENLVGSDLTTVIKLDNFSSVSMQELSKKTMFKYVLKGLMAF